MGSFKDVEASGGLSTDLQSVLNLLMFLWILHTSILLWSGVKINSYSWPPSEHGHLKKKDTSFNNYSSGKGAWTLQ